MDDDKTIQRLPWAGLLLGVIIGGLLNRAPDPYSDLIYCGTGAVVGAVLGLVARLILTKKR